MSLGGFGKKKLPNGEAAFRQLLSTYRTEAKKRKIVFDMTGYEFRLLTLKSCHYCGIEPQQIVRTKSGSEYVYNGVDRVDSNERYIFWNVVPCCGTCNLSKRQMTVEQFLAWVKRIHAYQKLNNKKFDSIK
jgi:hypothetical protein